MKSEALLACLVLIFASCSQTTKIHELTRNNPVPVVSPEETDRPKHPSPVMSRTDTLKVVDEYGYNVPYEMLQAAVKIASFKNVAERNGKVDLVFCISAPSELLHPKWQLRLYPVLNVNDKETVLEPVIITGYQYRQRQLQEYERYNRYLSGIITDSSYFVNDRALGIFLQRYGQSHTNAVEHYTDNVLKGMYGKKYDERDKAYMKYVKNPIDSKGFRLDTVIVDDREEVRCEYIQTIDVDGKVKKAQISIKGEIDDKEKSLYQFESPEKLSFYISSLSTLIEECNDEDSLYQKGLDLIRNREYKEALKYLSPYSDYNTAVAYVSLYYNASAKAILEKLPETPKSLYLSAIINSRTNNYKEATTLYNKACELDPSLVHRGNLDPEIYSLLSHNNN